MAMLERSRSQGTLEAENLEQGGSTMSTLAERVKQWGDELNRRWLEKGIEQGIERWNLRS